MERYTRDWFEQRALSSLKKINDGVWDYSDSLLIYVSSGVEVYEALQQTDTPYHRLVTEPEHAYLKSIARQVADLLPNDFDYIDLGPGTEHKEQFLFDELKAQGKTFTYVPVDISDHYLDLAEAHAAKQGIPVRRMKASFEELPALLGATEKPRLVSLGLTFSNYEPAEIIQLLNAIAGRNGSAFINAHLRDRVDMDALQRVYQDDAAHAFDAKLRLLGLDPETDVTQRVATNDIRVWCDVVRSNPKLEAAGVKAGDKLMIFQSLRYTKETLEEALQRTDRVSLDTGSPFVGTIMR